jgi:hypothetical protein
MSNHLDHVKALVMPTCNRVESTAKSLRTFIENSRKFDLECEYIVYDDSLSPRVRASYRAMLGDLQREMAVPIWYAGLDEKVGFAKRLLAGGDIPPDLVKFALFDVYKHGASTLGANRNAVFLDNPGRAFVSVDDDTFCTISKLPDATEETELSTCDLYSASEPCEFISFPDRKQLLTSLCYTETAFLQMHDRVLGKTIGDLALKNGTNGNSEQHRGKVLFSFNGLAGDCTWAPSASYVYFFVTGPSLARLASSAPMYEAARNSREILRVTRRICISRSAAGPGAFVGMDNRQMLPPFMPLGGAEDMFYWELKRKCMPEDFYAHVPWALLHQPPTARHFVPADLHRPREGFDFYSIVKAFLHSLPEIALAQMPYADRMQLVGRQFEDLGRLRPADFEATMGDLLRQEVARTKARLRQKLNDMTEACQLWKRDLEHCLREYWSTDHPDMAVPVDFMFLGGREKALKLGQTLLLQYGRLLLAWPEIMRRTAELRSAGVRVARSVG